MIRGTRGGIEFSDSREKQLDAAFRDPGVDSWRLIRRWGNALVKTSTSEQRDVFLSQLRQHLPHWPRELRRDGVREWPKEWRTVAEYLIDETDTYPLYEAGVCGDPRLRLSDGAQAVRLKRRYVGGAVMMGTGQVTKLGQTGEADLSGSLCLELGPGLRIAVVLHVEVKSPDGVQSPEQKLHQAAVERRGEIYLLVRTVESAVLGILARRAALLSSLTR